MLKELSAQHRRIGRAISWRMRRYWALPLTIWAVVLMRVAAPILLLRLHAVRAQRIGHLVNEPDLYLCRRMIEGQPARTIDRFFFHYDTRENDEVNKTALKLIGRALPTSPIWDHIDRANRLIPGGERHITPWMIGPDRWGYFDRCPTHLRFTDEERAEGEAFLARIGVNQRPIVCLFNRDSAYLRNKLQYKNFSYHDYRDSSIGNYLPAARALVQRGYFVMRMGACVEESVTNEDSIVDYATHYRNDFLDLYIASRCVFSLGTSTGLSDMARVFRKPTASANVCPFLTMQNYSSGWHELFIPKLYRWKKTNRILGLTEILENECDNLGRTEQFDTLGILVEENYPDDIADLANEMRGRIEGTWIDTKEDEELQARFWSMARATAPLKPRIGRQFLIKYGDRILR